MNINNSATDAYLKVTGNASFTSDSIFSTFAANNVLQGIAGQKIETAAGAKLLITGGARGLYTLTSGFNQTGTQAGWMGDDLIFANPFMVAIGAGGWFDKNYVLAVGFTPVSPHFPLMQDSVAELGLAMLNQVGLSPYSDNAGVRFMLRAFAGGFLGFEVSKLATATIEGAMQAAVAGGVQGVTMSAQRAGVGAITARTSSSGIANMKGAAVAMNDDGQVSQSGISGGSPSSGGLKNGLGLWIMPLWQNDKIFGMKAGAFKIGYNSNLGGVAIGADYIVENAFRFGLALNMGGGYAQSNGDFNKTDNSFNFWGVSAYGGWTQNNFGLTADVGYSSTFNKVQQETPAALAFGNLKSDVSSHAWSAGLCAEYEFETGFMDITPACGCALYRPDNPRV